MPTYTINPGDTLFFRDGRPMGTSGGHGARWPEPSVIFDALHAALHRAFPRCEAWEHPHDWARSSHRPHQGDRSQRFGSLATAGPFPVLLGTGRQPVAPGDLPAVPRWLFPRPQDVVVEGAVTPALLPLGHSPGSSDLPAPLLYPLASRAEPSKVEAPRWWTKQAIETYLHGEPQPPAGPWGLRDDDLFTHEWHTGIAIDPATQTTGRGEAAGRIFSAQYLRLRHGVALGIHASMPTKNGHPGHREERIDRLFTADGTLIVGGQQRACQVAELTCEGKPLPLNTVLPVSPAISGERVKWLLLSPAVFPAIAGGEILRSDGSKAPISAHPGGWLPNWIAPCDGFTVLQGDRVVEVGRGRVLLKAEPPRDVMRESREAWRKRVREGAFLDCRLVAARIPKPTVITGWTEAVHLRNTPWPREHGPRPTQLAVPAGAVYYFEGRDACRLAEVLSWHGAHAAMDLGATIRNRRSTLMGEKGFGLGVCGTWDFFENVAGRPAR